MAIAGLGGVGGAHLITLSRLGVSNFKISDFDSFEVHNFNRQEGANISSLNRPKIDVMRERVLDINPEANIEDFPEGISTSNIDAFFAGADLYVDSLDFFALSARKLAFKKCEEKRIPAITAAPLGMGCAFLAFLPGGMTFEEYFKLEECTEEEQLIRFLIGLSPSMLHRNYLVDISRADFKARKAPSTQMAINLCAGIAGTNALKILLGRGDVVTAPRGLHFDAYKNKLVRTWRPRGNSHPMQKVAYMIAKKLLL